MEDIRLKLSVIDLGVIGDALTRCGANKRLIMKFSMVESCDGDVWMTSEEVDSPIAMKNHTPTHIFSKPIETSMMSAPVVEPQPAPILDKGPGVGPTRLVDEPLMEIKIGVGMDAEKPKEPETTGGWDSRVSRPIRSIQHGQINIKSHKRVEVSPEMMTITTKLVEDMVDPDEDFDDGRCYNCDDIDCCCVDEPQQDDVWSTDIKPYNTVK